MSDAPRASDVEETVAPIAAVSTRCFGIVFLLTAALWFLILPWFSLAFVNNYRSYEVNFIDGLYQRKHIAAERAGARAPGRLVIVGGSGALFGVDAEVISAKLGIPVVNFATHAGLGAEYILDRAKRELRPGDRVLLCLEYELIAPTPAEFNRFAWDFAVSYDKRFLFRGGLFRGVESLYSIPLDDYLYSIKGWARVRKGRQRIQQGPYNLGLLSPAGDIRRVTEKKSLPAVDSPLDQLGDITRNPFLASFADFTKQRQIKVYFIWPNLCYPNGFSAINAVSLRRPKLKAALNSMGFIVLNEPDESMFPRAWYIDTVYHLNACASRVRAEDLVRRLRPALGLEPAKESATGYYAITGIQHVPRDLNFFADDPGIRVKYWRDDAPDHPGGVTIDGLMALCESGLPVYSDDPTVVWAAGTRGWGNEVSAEKKETLAEWLTRYPNHVFLIAGGGADLGASVPQDIGAALRDKPAVAAAFGTGRFSSVRKLVAGETTARWEEWLTQLSGKDSIDLKISVFADISSGKRFAIDINRMDLAGSGPGPHIVVIDPLAGIVVNAAAMPYPSGNITWRMYRLHKQNR